MDEHAGKQVFKPVNVLEIFYPFIIFPQKNQTEKNMTWGKLGKFI
jgi:hypothetical protein